MSLPTLSLEEPDKAYSSAFFELPSEIRTQIYNLVFNRQLIALQTHFNPLPRRPNSSQVLRTSRQFYAETLPIFFAKLKFEIKFVADLKGIFGATFTPLIRQLDWIIPFGQVRHLHVDAQNRWRRAGLVNLRQCRIIVHFPLLWGLQGDDTGNSFGEAKGMLRDIANDIRAASTHLCWVSQVKDGGQLRLEVVVSDGMEPGATTSIP